MQFWDYTLHAGVVQSKRRHDTSALEPLSLDLCRRMLRELRAGALEASHGVAGLPGFAVSLGVPEYVHAGLGEQVEHRGRIFSVRLAADKWPYQVNVVLPPSASGTEIDTEHPSPDAFAVGTIVALSRGFLGLAADDCYADLDAVIVEILRSRPAIATALNPAALSDPLGSMGAIAVAADFATCFAAVMLLEDNAI